MNILRRLPTSRLLAVCAAAVLIVAGGTAVAVAVTSSAPKPPPKPLPRAIHDALAAPAVKGVTANISFTNKLIDDSSVEGGNALLKGATGRLWATKNQLRLELQSGSGGGDSQLVVNARTWWAYDASSNTVYRGTLPAHKADKARKAGRETADHGVPSVADITKKLNEAAKNAVLSARSRAPWPASRPTRFAWAPSMTAACSAPSRSVGRGERCAPPRRRLCAGLELPGARAVGHPRQVRQRAGQRLRDHPAVQRQGRTGEPALARSDRQGEGAGQGRQAPLPGRREGARARRRDAAVPFKLSAPAKLAGLPRQDVRLLDWNGHPAALVTYGQNLGGIAVIERQPDPKNAKQSQAPKGRRDGEGQTRLPTLRRSTAPPARSWRRQLGTVVQFDRRGVSLRRDRLGPAAGGRGSRSRALTRREPSI